MSTARWEGSVGDKGGTGSQYPMQGYVDEFKYYYRVLTPTGWFSGADPGLSVGGALTLGVMALTF